MAFLIFGMLCALSFAGAVALKRRFEQALPIACFAVILLLYVCGLCGSVTVGVWLVWMLSACAAAFAGWSLWKKRVSLFDQWITPGWAAFAVLFFGFWVALNGRRPVVWDDLSHWATVVKNLFFSGGFGNGANTTTIFRNYPPATALFEFFFVKTGGAFREDMLYRANAAFQLALLMPMFARANWKRGWQALALVPIALVLPVTFFIDSYISLYVDPVLGLLLAYIVLAFLDGELEAPTWIGISLASAVLALAKPSGLGVATIALMILTCQRRTWEHVDSVGVPRLLRTRIVWALLPFATALLAFASWRVYCHAIGAREVFSMSGLTPQSLVDLLRRRAPTYRYTIIRAFYKAVIRNRHYGQLIKITFVQVMALFAGLGGLCAALRPKGRRGEMAWTLLTLMAGCAAFALSLLMTYLFAFKGEEATSLASMARYMGSYFLGMFAVLAQVSLLDALRSKAWWRVPIVALVAFATMYPSVDWQAFKRSTYDATPQIAYSQEEMRPFEDVKQRIPEPEHARVYCVAQDSNGYMQMKLRYVFGSDLPNQGWSTAALEKSEHPAQALAEVLRKDRCSYVYLFQIDERFAERFGALFENPSDIVQGQLYIVHERADSVTLALAP